MGRERQHFQLSERDQLVRRLAQVCVTLVFTVTTGLSEQKPEELAESQRVIDGWPVPLQYEGVQSRVCKTADEHTTPTGAGVGES